MGRLQEENGPGRERVAAHFWFFLPLFIFFFHRVFRKRESKKNKIKKIKEYFYQVRNYLPHEYLVVKTKVGLVLFLIKLIWFQN